MARSRHTILLRVLAALLIGTSTACGGLYNDLLNDTVWIIPLWSHSAAVDSTPLLNGSCVLPPTSGPVMAIVKDGDRLYIGGSFTRVGGRPFGAILDPRSGDTSAKVSQPRINGPVRCSIPDGEGGWYIGGEFTEINGERREGIARINPDGSLNEWRIDRAAAVRHLVMSGARIFACGDFATGAGRTGGIALIRRSGRVSGIEAITSYEGIDRMVVSESEDLLFVTGNATSPARGAIWFVDVIPLKEEDVRGIRYEIDGPVYDIAASGNYVFVGGSFTHFGDYPRNGIASLDASTGAVREWNPSVTGRVLSIAARGDIVYIAGAFSRVGARARMNLAAVNAVTASLLPWRPVTDGPVTAMAVDGERAFIGGDFRFVEGRDIFGSAVIDIATGAAGQWGRFAPTSFSAISVGSRGVFVGGEFTIAGGFERNNLMAVDATSGEVTAWHPNINGPVRAIAVRGNIVYAGGSFTRAGGEARNNLAAFYRDTAGVCSWDPDVNGEVRCLVLDDDAIYAGGAFTAVNRAAAFRSRLAAFDKQGTALPWDPSVNAPVSCLLLHDDILYAGGQFTTINKGALRRNRLAAIARDGSITHWDPGADGEVTCLASDEGVIYAGGRFKTIAGSPRKNLAVFDKASGSLMQGEYPDGAMVNAIAGKGTRVYLGVGDVLPAPEPIYSYSGARLFGDTPSRPAVSVTAVYKGAMVIVPDGNLLYVGGSFSHLGTIAWPNLATIDIATGALLRKECE